MATNELVLQRLNDALTRLIETSRRGERFVNGGMYGVEQIARIIEALDSYLQAYLDNNYNDIDALQSEIDVVNNLLQIQLGNVHPEDLGLTAENNNEKWNYIGNNGHVVFLPNSVDLFNAGLTGWKVTLENFSPNRSDISIQAFSGNVVDGQQSIPYVFGSFVQVTWDGFDSFITSVMFEAITFIDDLVLTADDCGKKYAFVGTNGSKVVTLPLINDFTTDFCFVQLENRTAENVQLTVQVQGPDFINVDLTSIVIFPNQTRVFNWSTPDPDFKTVLTWYIDVNGNFKPDSFVQNIGGADVGPQIITIHNEGGFLGGIGGLSTLVPGQLPAMTVFGTNDEDLLNITADAPIVLWGDPVILKADSNYLLSMGVQGEIDPSEIENHVVMFGTVQDAVDGNQYAALEIGPAVAYLLVEFATDANDFDVTDTPTDIVSLTTVNNYVDPSVLHFEVRLSEEGDKTALFNIELLKNASVIYTHPTIDLQGISQIVTFTLPLESGDFPIVPGDDFLMRIEGVSTNPNTQAFVRGSITASRIEIRQEADQVVPGVVLSVPGLITDFTHAYRIETAGTYTLPAIFQFTNRGIVQTAFKNATTGIVELDVSGGNVINVGFGKTAETSIFILPGNGVVFSMITGSIYEVVAPNLFHRHDFVDGTLPFSTISTTYVTASTDTTPVMVLSRYKLSVSFTISLDANNRRWNARIVVDGGVISPEYEIEPKDPINNLPLNYEFIVDWTASSVTHTVALEVRKAGGAGAAIVTLNDFRYNVDRWTTV